jgi:DNA-binding NarL/FixJ family response regulator
MNLKIIVLSPHRLVPLALRAAGRASGSYDVIASATDAEEALAFVATLRPDVFVFDPTTVSLGKAIRLLDIAGPHLPQPNNIALLLEPAQAATAIAARFLWEAGVRCAMTSQETPDIWPVAIMAAARGTGYVSPTASELFGLPRSWGSGGMEKTEDFHSSGALDYRRRSTTTIGA